MATSDRNRFLGNLMLSEAGLTRMLAELAHNVGDLVLRMAGPDGTVPVERLGSLQKAAEGLVDLMFIGQGGNPFDQAGMPASRFAGLIGDGQLAMVDLALERTGSILDARLPADVKQGLVTQPVKVRTA